MASIRERGLHQFQARVTHKGYQPLVQTFTTRQAAEAWAAEMEERFRAGEPLLPAPRKRLIFREALDRYEQTVTVDKRGALAERGRINRWRRSPLSHRFLDSIRGADLAQHRDRRVKEGRSGNTIRLELAVVSHLYEVARKEWGMEALVNPVRAIRMPKLPAGRTRRLLPQEEASLKGHCERNFNEPLRVAISLAIETAMRRSELVYLEWANVDLGKRTAYLPHTKNGTARFVPLSSAAVEILAPLARVGPTVLGVEADWLSHQFIEACGVLSIKDLHFHDLRHEATSRLFERGLNMMEVAAITGHKTLQMLKRYTHLRVEDLVARLG